MNDVDQIKKVNVGQETFKVILDMIMQGRWKEGERIPSENEFKDMLGVSRHTVRAALNNLNMLGIVETRHGDGNYIKFVGIGLYIDLLIPYLFINEENIDVIMEFREGIETVTARYAAERATPKDIEILRQKMIKCTEVTNVEQYLVADFDFHYMIAKMSGNDLLLQSMFVIKKYCFGALAKYLTKENSDDGPERHQKIFDCIVSHDADMAARHMNEHIIRVMDMLKANSSSYKKKYEYKAIST